MCTDIHLYRLYKEEHRKYLEHQGFVFCCYLQFSLSELLGL